MPSCSDRKWDALSAVVTQKAARERLAGRNRVITALVHFGSMSRADLARRAELAPSTVTGIVAALMDDGLVVEVDGDPAPTGGVRAGRPGIVLALHRSNGVVVGIDFGKRHVRVAVAELSHHLLTERSHALAPDRPASEDISRAVTLVDDALGEIGMDRSHVVGVGMGIPGPVRTATGQLGDSTILPGWVGVHAPEAMSTALGLSVQVDNDANLGALSEWMWGAARGYDDVAYLKVSTGVGAGLILDGIPYSGAGGTAGEIGHIVVDPAGPICRCGNRGCLEMIAGGGAVLQSLRAAHGEDLTMGDVIVMAHGGDTGCIRSLADSGVAIGTALATLCNLVNPRRVVVGGDLAAAGELLVGPLRESLKRGALRSAAEDVDVVMGTFGERAEVLGAVALALRSSRPFHSRRSPEQARQAVD